MMETTDAEALGRELQFSDEAAIMYDRLLRPQCFGPDKYVSTTKISYVIVRKASFAPIRSMLRAHPRDFF